MAKEYATVQVHNGTIVRVDTGAANRSPQDTQFDGLKGHPVAAALNKLAEFDYQPLAGVVDHGELHPGGASFTLFFVREK